MLLATVKIICSPEVRSKTNNRVSIVDQGNRALHDSCKALPNSMPQNHN